MEFFHDVFQKSVQDLRDLPVSGFCGRHAEKFSIDQFELVRFVGEALELLERHYACGGTHGTIMLPQPPRHIFPEPVHATQHVIGNRERRVLH